MVSAAISAVIQTIAVTMVAHRARKIRVNQDRYNAQNRIILETTVNKGGASAMILIALPNY